MTTFQPVNPHSVEIQSNVTSSVVPIFRDSAFDAETTGSLGNAYDIACRALHPNGQPPGVQEQLARKIIEAATRGERDPERLATIALGILGPFHRDVTRRFGLVPNFFMSAIEGSPGAGKTTLALQFLLEGARVGELGLYITLSETEAELREVATSHGWLLDDHIHIFELVPPESLLDEKQQQSLYHNLENGAGRP